MFKGTVGPSYTCAADLNRCRTFEISHVVFHSMVRCAHSMALESEHRTAALEGRLARRVVKAGMLQRLRAAFNSENTVDGPGMLRPVGPRQVTVTDPYACCKSCINACSAKMTEQA